MCVSYLGSTWHQKLLRWWRHCNALENLGPRHPQDFFRPCSAFMETIFPDVRGLFRQDEGTCHKGPMVQESGLRSTTTVWGVDSPDLNPTSICVRNVLNKKSDRTEISAATMLGYDTPADLQGSPGVHDSKGPGCSDSKRGTNTIFGCW